MSESVRSPLFVTSKVPVGDWAPTRPAVSARREAVRRRLFMVGRMRC
jgi:hypothetical protein